MLRVRSRAGKGNRETRRKEVEKAEKRSDDVFNIQRSVLFYVSTRSPRYNDELQVRQASWACWYWADILGSLLLNCVFRRGVGVSAIDKDTGYKFGTGFFGGLGDLCFRWDFDGLRF